MSAGGGAGSASYPDYIEGTQEAWLRGTASSAILQSNFQTTDEGGDGGAINISGLILSRLAEENPYAYSPHNAVWNDSVAIPTGTAIVNAMNAALSSISTRYPELDVVAFSNEINTAMEDMMQEAGDDTDTVLSAMTSIITGAFNNATVSLASRAANSHTEAASIGDSIVTDVVTQVNDVLDEIRPYYGLNTSESTRWLQIDSLVTNLITAVQQRVRDNTSAVFTGAMNKALALLDDAEGKLQDDADAFESKSVTRMQKAVGRFTASMAMQGGAMTSPMAHGLAMMENERAAEVSEYTSKRALDILNGVMAAFPTVATKDTGAIMDAHIRTYSDFAASYQKELDNRISLYVQSLAERTKLFMQYFQTFAQFQQHATDRGFALYNNSYSNTQQGRNAFIMQTLSALQQLRAHNQDAYVDAQRGLAEALRIKYVINKEYYDTAQERLILSKTYGLGMYQHAANLLAASSGAAVIPDKPSKSQSALAGAMAGASVGAVAGAPGMIAGAAVGAIGAAVANK